MKFRSKILTVALLAAPVVCIIIYLLCVYKEPFTIISPTDGLKSGFNWNIYTDKLHNGNSKISRSVQQNTFTYNYCLKDGYRYRFVLIGISPNDSGKVDLSIYDQIDISIKAKNGKGILFYLYTALPEEKRALHPSRPHQYILDTDTAFKDIRLSMHELYTPDWWYTEVHETRASLGPPLFNQTLAFSFGNCIHIKTGIPDEVTVKEITFSVNLLSRFLKILPYVIGYYLLLLFFYILSKRKKKKVVFMETDAPSTMKDKKEEQLVFHYIGIHYPEPRYTIEQLSVQTGLPQARINRIIEGKTGLNFKQFLNDLRITEAERLLKQTDLPVNELYEIVGFKTREHFSRKFKTKTGVNPLELRKKEKQNKHDQQ